MICITLLCFWCRSYTHCTGQPVSYGFRIGAISGSCLWPYSTCFRTNCPWSPLSVTTILVLKFQYEWTSNFNNKEYIILFVHTFRLLRNSNTKLPLIHSLVIFPYGAHFRFSPVSKTGNLSLQVFLLSQNRCQLLVKKWTYAG